MRSSGALRPALAVLAAIALLWPGAGLGSGVARGEAVYRFGVPPWVTDALVVGIDPQLLAGLPTAGYVERPESFYDDIRAIVDLLPR